MKRTFVFMLMLFAIVYGASALDGVIRELTGDVEIKSAGKSAFVTARAGDKVAQDTIISTGFKSTAVIEVGSSVITVRPLTRLSLSEIQSSSGTETTSVGLQTGRVRVDVKPPAGTKANFTVQGPNATASVRGTSFEFDTVKIAVNEGTVAFSGTSGPKSLVKAGGSLSIEEDVEQVEFTATVAKTARTVRTTSW
jgi:hypothetical protein